MARLMQVRRMSAPSDSSALVSARLAWMRARSSRMALLRSWILVRGSAPSAARVMRRSSRASSFGQLLTKCDVEVVGELLLLGHAAVEQVGDSGGEIARNPQGGVVASDGIYDLGDRRWGGRTVSVAGLDRCSKP